MVSYFENVVSRKLSPLNFITFHFDSNSKMNVGCRQIIKFLPKCSGLKAKVKMTPCEYCLELHV